VNPADSETSEQLKIIVGLGNPGRVYADSRHNLGFRCLNLFARRLGIEFKKQQAKARVGFGDLDGEKLVLAKPRTFMNRSGESVESLIRFYKTDLSDLLIIYDDVDLPLGKIRIRERGGAAGHNGMKSIIWHLDSQEFPRLRLGIGATSADENGDRREARSPEYVLSHFLPEEKPIVEEMVDRVAEAIECILTEGIAVAMNRYNSG